MVVDGGVAAMLLGYVTLEVKFNLVRAITVETGRVLAEGSGEDGKLLAHGTSTCLVR